MWIEVRELADDDSGGELVIKDENGFRAASIVIRTGQDSLGRDVVRLNVSTVPGDGNIVVETRIVQGH